MLTELEKKKKAVRFIIIMGASCIAILVGVYFLSRKETRIVKKTHENGVDKEVWVYRSDIFGRRKKVKEFVYFENGNKECEVDYRHGKVNGWARMWYESGQLRLEATYKNDKAHGVRRAYHENGQLFCRAEYENGKLMRRKNWDEDGNEIYLDMDRPDPF